MTLFRLSVSTLAVAGVLAGLLLTPPAVGATLPDQDPTDPPTLIKHLRTELRSDEAPRQERALMDVIALAGCVDTCSVKLLSAREKTLRVQNETGLGSAIDLDVLIPDLMAVYRHGPADGHRLLALSALLNIGNEGALEQLIDEGAQQSSRVESNTQRGLAAYYLDKYPELLEKAARTGRIAIEDVRRAEVLRVRAARSTQK